MDRHSASPTEVERAGAFVRRTDVSDHFVTPPLFSAADASSFPGGFHSSNDFSMPIPTSQYQTHHAWAISSPHAQHHPYDPNFGWSNPLLAPGSQAWPHAPDAQASAFGSKVNGGEINFETFFYSHLERDAQSGSQSMTVDSTSPSKTPTPDSPGRIAFKHASQGATARTTPFVMTPSPSQMIPMVPPTTQSSFQVNTKHQSDEEAERWLELILENVDDVVHVVSLKGNILYVSPSCVKTLGYEVEDLRGKSLSSICHPADHQSVLRELKSAKQTSDQAGKHRTPQPINFLYRVRRKTDDYVWLEASGTVFSEDFKGRKCVVLVGRTKPLPYLSWEDIDVRGGLGETEFWVESALTGLLLYATAGVEQVLGFSAEELVGTSFNQLIPPESMPHVLKALENATQGTCVQLTFAMLSREHVYLTVYAQFHALTASNAKTVFCQINSVDSDRRRSSQCKGSRNRSSSVSSSESATSPAQALFHRGTVLRPASNAISVVGERSWATQHVAGPPKFSATPSAYHRSLQSRSKRGNIFAELSPDATSTFFFEIHQLCSLNKRLREELVALEQALKKRQAEVAGGGDNPDQEPARHCANCGAVSTPEWRTGPSGRRELCNACGLRYSKVLKAKGLELPRAITNLKQA